MKKECQMTFANGVSYAKDHERVRKGTGAVIRVRLRKPVRLEALVAKAAYLQMRKG